MSFVKPEWDIYARTTLNPIIQAYYYFTVWRNYRILLYGLEIHPGQLLELGSSTGQISLRLSKMYNFLPTLVDTSTLALTIASYNYRRKGITPITIKKNILELNLEQKYDLVHSHGLLEHFTGDKQLIALESHIKHIQIGGWLICWVPSPDIFYRLNRWYLEHSNQWIFGFENPISLKDVLRLFGNKKLRIRRIRHLPGWILRPLHGRSDHVRWPHRREADPAGTIDHHSRTRLRVSIVQPIRRDRFSPSKALGERRETMHLAPPFVIRRVGSV